MKTFKAAVLTESNRPLELLNLIVPENIESNQVLIKIDLAALCGSQVGEILAIKGTDQYLPHLLGHEAIASVLKVGSDVINIAVGDKVIAHWMKNQKNDSNSISYSTVDFEKINAGQVAIFSEVAIVSENRLTKINSQLKNELLAVIGCGFLTSYGVLKRDLKVSNSSNGKILILGFGGIGQIVYLLGRKLSQLEFSVLDYNELNLEKAIQLGVKKSFKELDALDSAEFDFIIDTTGNVKIIERAYQLLSKGGTICLVGVTSSGSKISIDPMPLHYGQKIIGSFGGQAVPEEDIPEIINLIESDPIWFQNSIGERFELDAINEAIETLREGKNTGKILIGFGK
jgi:S-(hydroxymethyl)glutathione dehydrogenase/alcohol dehydrogenase